MKVRKAVIVAAGLGTRLLPASKVIPKEILPVVDTPAIQLVAEEAIAAGIEEIILVVSPGRALVRDHFRRAEELERRLALAGKHDLLEALRKTDYPVRFRTVYQDEPRGLGHAVLQARHEVGDEAFAVMLPDDIFDAPRPCLGQLLDAVRERQAPVVALMRVARSEAPRYGMAEVRPLGPRLYELIGMVEKPAPEKAPGEFAIMGRYLLPPGVFDDLAALKPGAGGEIQLTDGLLALGRRRRIYGCEFEGVRYDLGDRAGYILAQVGFGLKRPDLADRVRAGLEALLFGQR